VILMIAVMVVTNMLFAPDRPAPGDLPADSVTLVDTAAVQPAPGSADTTAVPPAPGTPAWADTTQPSAPPSQLPVAAAADTVRIATPLLELGFRGDGAVVSARLLEYEAFGEDAVEGQHVELAPEGGALLEPVLTVGSPGTQVAQVPL